LIPTKYFEKTIERLSTANGDRLQIKYKLSEAVIKNCLLRIKIPFLFVQDLRNQSSFPFNDVIRRYHYLYMRNLTTFQFVSTPVHRTLNLLQFKTNQINFLKEEVSFKTLKT
ncbi:hypothetical protein S83_016982, partial [Arachis hypogaea]